MSDKEPLLSLQINGEEVLAHRWNTSLFTFIGELAAYNHVFVATEDIENGYAVGKYIFSDADAFVPVSKFVEIECFPQHRNLTEVAECDMIAFDRAHYKEFRETASFPEEWAK
jgi:hypothetical protein